MDLPRHTPDNPLEYTKVQLAHKKTAMKAMAKDYPKLDLAWIEWVYDFGQYTKPEELERIMNEGVWETPGMFAKPLGGLFTDKIEVFEDGQFVKI